MSQQTLGAPRIKSDGTEKVGAAIVVIVSPHRAVTVVTIHGNSVCIRHSHEPPVTIVAEEPVWAVPHYKSVEETIPVVIGPDGAFGASAAWHDGVRSGCCHLGE